MKTVLFDAYGTLFDLEAALKPAASRLGARAGAVFERWRTLQLEYAWLSALGERRLDFDECTRLAFLDTLAAEGIADEGLGEMLAQGFKTVAAYPDAAECLAAFRNAGWRTAILSNGEPAMLDTAVEAAGLRAHLDAVLSIAASGSYKPAPAAYEIGAAYAGAARAQTLFVSSNWWDADGARNFGFTVAHIKRPGKFWPKSVPRPELTPGSLAELAKIAAT